MVRTDLALLTSLVKVPALSVSMECFVIVIPTNMKGQLSSKSRTLPLAAALGEEMTLPEPRDIANNLRVNPFSASIM